MIRVSIFRKAKKSGTGGGSGTLSGYMGGQKVAHAVSADRATVAQNLAQDSSDWDKIDQKDAATAAAVKSYADRNFLSKLIPDRAREVITFDKGLKAGTFEKDLRGAALWEDEDQNWHIEGDFLHARKKLVAKEVQIEEVTHVGGQQLSTAASMLCAFVIDKSTYWRCFFVKKGNDGRVVTNKWKVGDQAFCRTFNLDEQGDQTQDEQDDQTQGDHYFWRLVVASSADSGTVDTGQDGSGSYTIDGITYNVDDFHFIDLSKTVCASNSDAPLPGDSIVQLGYQPNDDSSRQNAIIIAGAGSGSPYIYILTGIHTFTLPDPEIKLKPGDNHFTGTVNMTAGSKLGDSTLQTLLDLIEAKADGAKDTADDAQAAAYLAQAAADEVNEALGNLSTGNENLVVNGGFTGVYESESVESNLTVNSGTGIFSDQWGYWSTHDGCTTASSLASATGWACQMANGTLVQTISRGIKQGKDYTFSLLALSSGNVTVNIGGVQRSLTLVSGQRASVTFTTASTSNTLTITGSGTITEIVLIQGNIPVSDWIPSPVDNNKYLSYYKNLAYLLEALERGSTSVIGGLILTNQIRVGNSENGQFVLETGGMNGANPYADNNAPFLWGGGNMDKAIYTIGRYADNPNYEPTQQELAQMAKFVVTHGGRAILNDIILRGYIHALGGVFKNVRSPNGNWSIDEAGNMTCQNATIKGNQYTPMFRLTAENFSSVTSDISQGKKIDLTKTGLNIVVDSLPSGVNQHIYLPQEGAEWNGAKLHLVNNCPRTAAIGFLVSPVVEWEQDPDTGDVYKEQFPNPVAVYLGGSATFIAIVLPNGVDLEWYLMSLTKGLEYVHTQT